MRTEFYAIGRITKCIGLKGEIAVQSLSNNRERFAALKEVWIGSEENKRKLFRIEKVTIQPQSTRLRLEGVESRSDADDLVGKHLYVTEKDLVQVPEGTYFIHDIVGSSVIGEQGESIGKVTEVWKLPANDVYVIRNGEHEYLVPALRSIIKKVDLAKKEIEIKMIDGLLDEK